jgi:hypothetical protein
MGLPEHAVLAEDTLKRDRIIHWARHHALLDWVRLGWVIAKPNAESHHDNYSVTVEWLCECPIVRPQDR